MARPGEIPKVLARRFLALSLAGLAAACAVFGYRAAAGNGQGSAAPAQPLTATPSPEEEAGAWTPERLKAAEPLALPSAPQPPSSADDAQGAAPRPSESGAGSPGGAVPPEEDRVLIPGVAEPEAGEDAEP